MFSFLKYEYHVYNRNPSCCNISIFTTGIHHDVSRLLYEWHDTTVHLDSIYTAHLDYTQLIWTLYIREVLRHVLLFEARVSRMISIFTTDIHVSTLNASYRGAMRVLQRGHKGFLLHTCTCNKKIHTYIPVTTKFREPMQLNFQRKF